MRLLMLYGVNCTPRIWDRLKPYLNEFEVDYVEYPHDITMKAVEVDNITKWVYEKYGEESYQAVIGHSLGGIIALQLAAVYEMKFDKIIYLDTNLKPANEFYKNLMTSEHMNEFGNHIFSMFQEERKYYTNRMFDSLQDEFDYTGYVKLIDQKIYGIYGDRNKPDYKNKISDLNLPLEVCNKIEFRFVNNSCHMIMMENPEQLFQLIKGILKAN